MPRLRYKSFADPDHVRELPNALAEVINVGDVTVGRSRFDPGWRWSKDVQSIAGTPSCQLHHLGYSISGTMEVAMDDGQVLEIPPGSVYEIPPFHDARVVGDRPWLTIEWTSARLFGVAPEGPGERVLATLMFTDIVESTSTLQRIGDSAWRDLLLDHNARLRDELNTFRGREVATTGDGVLALFDGATRAVRCAAAMTRSARRIGLSIRIGIHSGEIELVGDDARGLAVHTAARILSLAGTDEVLVSSTTSDLLEGSGLILEDAGTHELKGLPGRRRVLRLVTPEADDAETDTAT